MFVFILKGIYTSGALILDLRASFFMKWKDFSPPPTSTIRLVASPSHTEKL